VLYIGHSELLVDLRQIPTRFDEPFDLGVVRLAANNGLVKRGRVRGNTAQALFGNAPL
jgi:hypothetical protein